MASMDASAERNAGERLEPTSNQVRKINLALQGGGAHGAFTWGVLDRLLDEEKLAFDGLSATSAGAMNAAAFAYGLTVGGRDGAHKALTDYWKRVSEAARRGPLQPSPFDRMLGDHKLSWSPIFSMIGFVTRMLSPYQFNPINYNPLREVVEQSIDFGVLQRANCPVKLFLSATNVRTGKVKIFAEKEISVDAVMASACLPTMFHAVEIDGEAYWDGGLGGNPPLIKLAQQSTTADLLLVQVTPTRDSYVPITLAAIDRRLDQIAANAALKAEIAAIAWAQSHTAPALRLSTIAAEDSVEGLAQRSSTDLGRGFIRLLHRSGREAAERRLGQGAGVSQPARARAAEPVLA